MRLDVLQAFALCSHGQPFLRDATDRQPEVLRQNPAYRSVYELAFERTGRGLQAGSVGEGSGPWLRRLKSEDVTALRLHLQPCGFTQATDAGEWGIISDGNRGTELWHPQTKARFMGRNDATPHQVVFVSTRFSRWNMPQTMTLSGAAQRLALAVDEGLKMLRSYGNTSLLIALEHSYEMSVLGRTGSSPDEEVIHPDAPVEAQQLYHCALRVAKVTLEPGWPKAGADENVSCARKNLWSAAMASFEAAAAA
jgi:hypothetical protein